MTTALHWRSAFVTGVGRLFAARHLHWAVWIFALAFVLRAVWTVYVNPSPWSDAFFYYWSAESLAAGDGFRNLFDPDEYTTAFPPGYPLVLASLFAVFGPSLFVARLFNVLVGAATAVLVYAIAANVRDQRTGIVAGLLMALFPSQIFFTTLIMTETFFVALSASLVLLLMLWLAGKESMKDWQVFALGVLLGFMSLVRAEALLLAPALVVLWKLWSPRWRQIGRYLLLLVVGMALFIGPWTARNYVRFGEFVLVRGTAEDPLRVARIGLSPNYEQWSGRFAIETGEPLTVGGIVEYYGTQPWQVATLGARKVRDLFGNDDPFRWIVGTSLDERTPLPALSPGATSRWSAVANGYYYAVGAAALLGALFWLSRRDRRSLVILWFIASWSLIHLLVVPSVRFHFPVIPMISLLAAFTLVAAWDWVRKGLGAHGPRSDGIGRDPPPSK